MYRRRDGLEVLLAHPGGPFFARRDEGAWTIPKGLVEAGEGALAAAVREFREEIGLDPGTGPFHPLGEVVQRGGKRVAAWAFEGDCPEPFTLTSNTFELEWPPRSGRRQRYPEIDRAAFFGADEARRRLIAAQGPFIDRLLELCSREGRPGPASG